MKRDKIFLNLVRYHELRANTVSLYNSVRSHIGEPSEGKREKYQDLIIEVTALRKELANGRLVQEYLEGLSDIESKLLYIKDKLTVKPKARTWGMATE